MNILVGIPCYQCAPQIRRVLSKISSYPLANIDFLIVDNASPDGTQESVINTLMELPSSQRERFTFIIHQKNYGLGGSFKTLMNYAFTEGYDHFVLFHGDDQAFVEDLFHLIELIRRENPDCLFGARFMKGSKLLGYSRLREFGNRLLNVIFSLVLGVEIFELGSGLNSYKIKALPMEEITRFPNHLAFDINLLFHFMDPNHGYDARFFPISWQEEDQKSNASNFIVAKDILLMLLNYKMGRKNLLCSTEIRAYRKVTL